MLSTGDRTVLETVVNVVTSVPFVLVGLQTPRFVVAFKQKQGSLLLCEI